VGGVRESRRRHEQVLDHHSRHRDPIVADRLVSALLARVVQSDALAGCGERSVAGGSTSSLLTDAALGRAGSPRQSLVQETPQHRSNTHPTPSPCHAAVVIGADNDFLPAVEMAVGVLQCPVFRPFLKHQTTTSYGTFATSVARSQRPVHSPFFSSTLCHDGHAPRAESALGCSGLQGSSELQSSAHLPGPVAGDALNLAKELAVQVHIRSAPIVPVKEVQELGA